MTRSIQTVGILFLVGTLIYSFYSRNQMQDEALTNFIKQCESEHEQPKTCQTLADTHGEKCFRVSYSYPTRYRPDIEPRVDAKRMYQCTLVSYPVWQKKHANDLKRKREQHQEILDGAAADL